LQLEQPDVWNDQEQAQKLGKERAQLEQLINALDELTQATADTEELLQLAAEEDDEDTVKELSVELASAGKELEKMEFKRMFSGQLDAANAFIDIQSGSGGTEAQDWANMLLRMYLRWCDDHQFAVQIIAHSEGEVAGIKSATVKVSGEYAFGYLRTETGVHRLVRKSPFDSGNRRHTSFASVVRVPGN